MLFKTFGSVAVLATSFLAQGASAQWDPKNKNMTAVYWGQNAGYVLQPTKNNQADLWTTCNNTNIDIVIISFVTKFVGKAGLPILNLSNQCGNVFPYAENPKNSTDILNCPQIGEQITKCQKIGKKILLSLGGATYKDAGWKDVNSARASANAIWSMFGPPGSVPFKYRPFGNSTMDGYDLDFENVANKPNSDAFAIHMKAKFNLTKSRTYLLTAAPQCPNPDLTLDLALTKAPFDAVFIQFYNNNCAGTTWAKGKSQLSNNSFNMQMWQNWATTKSMNKNIKLFVGLLGGGINGTTGYISKTVAQKVVTDSTRFANFGGVSFWDSSVLNINTGILPGVRDVLTGKVKITLKRDDQIAQIESGIQKRDAEVESDVEEREIKAPVGGASAFSANDFSEAKVPAEAVQEFRRRHLHRRRGSKLLN